MLKIREGFAFATLGIAVAMVLAVGEPMAMAASIRQDPPVVNWSHAWNFDDGLQGWTITDASPNDPYTPRWVDPVAEATGPLLADGAASGGGGGNLYLPDRSTATFPIPGGAAAGFVFQADVYVPNLYPLTGFPNGLAGNFLHEAGIRVLRNGDYRETYISGVVVNPRPTFKAGDRTWDSTTQYLSGWAAMDDDPGSGADHLETWWDQSVTLRIDYRYTEPLFVSYYVYVPWAFPSSTDGQPGWYLLARRGANPDPAPWWGTLALGGGASWTQAQFDNVRFVPEPGCLALGGLAAGLFAVRRSRPA